MNILLVVTFICADVDRTGTGETGSLVGSFPEARLVLGEGTANPCGRRSHPE